MSCTRLLLVVLCWAVAQGRAASVVKRSDDSDPLAAVFEQQGNAILNLQTELAALRSDLQAVRAATQEVQVAFSAQSTAAVLNVGDNRPILFDSIISNIGRAYDPTTGVFTAPRAGVYLFFINLMKEPKHGFMEARLFKGSDHLCATRTVSPDYDFGNGACVSAVHLQTGDKVFVKRTFGDVYLHGYMWSSFNGVLVSPDR